MFILDADLGDTANLDASKAAFRHTFDRFGTMIPKGTFEHQLNDTYGSYFSLLAMQLRGDNRAVLAGTPAIQAQAAAMKPGGEFEEYIWHQLQRDIADMDAESAYATGNFSRAAADGQISTSNMLAMHPRRIPDLRQLDDERVRLALALARQGQSEEALKLLGPVSEHQKAWRVKLHEDEQLKLEMARTLLASTVAHPGGGRAELEEAQKMVASVPAAMRGLSSVAVWKVRIDEELKKHH
jgi:hypothetical protein